MQKIIGEQSINQAFKISVGKKHYSWIGSLY